MSCEQRKQLQFSAAPQGTCNTHYPAKHLSVRAIEKAATGALPVQSNLLAIAVGYA